MCTHSVSGSSLLSSYDEDDARETSGRSRREFEQIDAVLYDEEVAKRSSIKKICDEWSSKPHFRIRGRTSSLNLPQQDLSKIETRSNRLSSYDYSSNQFKITNPNFSDVNVTIDEKKSGRSSVDSIERSTLSDNVDLDNDNELDDTDSSSTILCDRFSASEANSFDTDDDDDDENLNYSSIQSKRNRQKNPQLLIKCLKDSIINSLATSLVDKFLTDETAFLQRYVKYVCANNSVRLRTGPRPSSVPPRSSSHGRLSQVTAATTSSVQQNPPTTTIPAPYRSTTDTCIELESILHVRRIGGTKLNSNQTTNSSPLSPRKPQGSVPPTPVRVERASTSLSIEKRNQQQISLVGTAIPNLPSQGISSTPQSSQAHVRQPNIMATMRRHGSATTISSAAHTIESITRLPPISHEHILMNDPGKINRSHTITTTVIESSPIVTRIVSGKSTMSNFSSTNKMRTYANVGKLSRASRSIIITPNKDFNNSPSISPVRSITTNISSTILKATSATRSNQQPQKKTFVTTKTTPSSSSSTAMKVPATHIC